MSKLVFIEGSKFDISQLASVQFEETRSHDLKLQSHTVFWLNPPALFFQFKENERAFSNISGLNKSSIIPIRFYGFSSIKAIEELSKAGFYNEDEALFVMEKMKKNIQKMNMIHQTQINKGFGIENYLEFKEDFNQSEVRYSNDNKVIQEYDQFMKAKESFETSFSYIDGKISSTK